MKKQKNSSQIIKTGQVIKTYSNQQSPLSNNLLCLLEQKSVNRFNQTTMINYSNLVREQPLKSGSMNQARKLTTSNNFFKSQKGKRSVPPENEYHQPTLLSDRTYVDQSNIQDSGQWITSNRLRTRGRKMPFSHWTNRTDRKSTSPSH